MNLQMGIQTVVDVERRHPDNTTERIHRLRKEQWNIIITAILFGLTLNLIADFISSLYDSSVEPSTLLIRGIVAGLAIALTGVLMLSLILRDMRDECKTECEIQLSFFFNRDTGIPYPVYYYFPSDRLAIEFDKAPEEQKENLAQLVKDAAASRDFANLIPFLELVTIYEITHRQVPIDGESVLIPFKDKIRLVQPPLGLYLRAYDFKVPGCFDLEYKQHEKGGKLDITWKSGYHGDMSIGFEFSQGYRFLVDKDLTLGPKPGQSLRLYELITTINLKAKFSPLRLFIKRSNTEKLIKWSNRLSNRLVDTADWSHFIQPYEQSEKRTTYSISLFEANE